MAPFRRETGLETAVRVSPEQTQPTRASNMPTVHSSLGARGAASAASAVGVAPGGGGYDGAVLHDFLIEMTTGRPWRPAPSTHRRRPSVVTSGLPLVPPTSAALGAGNLAGSSAAADADARRFSSRSAAARRIRRKAKSYHDNLREDFGFLMGPAPTPPDTALVDPATTTTASTPSSTEWQPGVGPPQVAESGALPNYFKGAPEVGVAPLRGPEFLNKRGRKELKRQLEAQKTGAADSASGVQDSAKGPLSPSTLPTGNVVAAKSDAQCTDPLKRDALPPILLSSTGTAVKAKSNALNAQSSKFGTGDSESQSAKKLLTAPTRDPGDPEERTSLPGVPGILVARRNPTPLAAPK